jgi:predicted lysophospholipase L1 biosynthesis ABC-type transport system permease subunit
VVNDLRNRGPREEPGPVLFLPLAQFYQAYPWQPDSTALLLSTAGPPERLRSALAAMAREVDPRLPLFQVGSLDGQLAAQQDVERFFAFLFFCQAALAVCLVGVGLHGLVAFVVNRRSRELAVRIALGARGLDLLFLLGRQTLRPVAIGLLLGLPAAVLASRSLSALLFGVHPGDAVSLAGAMGLLLLIAAVAASGPLARALAADVTEVLRME